MKILKNVIVKQILTEKSKQVLLEKFELQWQQLQNEIEQLQFEKKKLTKTKKIPSQAVITQVEKEITTRKEMSQFVQFQLEQLDILPLGSELKESELKALSEVNVGDRWEDFMKDQMIIIKDGIIVEIR